MMRLGTTSIWLVAACMVSTAHAASAPTRLQVEPPQVVLQGQTDRQQVVVSGFAAESAVRDWTASARFRIRDETIAAVSPRGVVTPRSDGTTELLIEAGPTESPRTIFVPVTVSGSTIRRPVRYRTDVVAVLSKAGCNMGACHGNFNGKGGFRLSLRGEDPTYDLAALTHDAFGRRVDPQAPDRSLVLLKPTGRLPHEGGLRFSPNAPEADVLRSWIAGGARDDEGTVPRVTRLRVFPEERMAAAPSLDQQLVVTAEFSDGTRRDVTREAAYDLSEPTQFSIDADGFVRADRPGEVVVAVRYLNGRGISRLAFLADRPGFVWDGPEPRTDLDRAVFAKLRALNVQPSAVVDDATFLRRASLDAIGRLPEPEEARAFLANPDPDKRSKLVRRLLDRAEFADVWAWKWADLLRNEEKTMGDKGVWIFQRWLRDQFARDTPLDETTRALIASTGSTWTKPATSFYRTNRDPQTAAETVAQVFLGVRLQCARCHNHPFDVWTQDDYYGLAACFSNVKRKDVDSTRKDDLDKHEINGDEFVYLQGRPEMVQPRSGATLPPKPPGGSVIAVSDETNALDGLAGWLTRDNPQFARNLANRVWFHLMGRGVVEPVDDFRDSNPPSNPVLLDALTARFVASGMRLKPLVEAIMTSRVYELGARPDPTNVDDEANFARFAVKLLPAEVLLDSIGQALGRPERFAGAPVSARAVQLPGARMGGSFLKVFGKPDRLLTCECERSEATTLAQAFQLINGEAVRQAVESPDNRIGRALDAGRTDDRILDELYLAALCRLPRDAERQQAREHLAKVGSDRRRAWDDLAWAVINSKEFLLRH